MMTEKEVLDNLALFKTALHKLKDQNASLQKSYDELQSQFNGLTLNHNEDVEVTRSALTDLQKELDIKEAYIEDLKLKTLGTIRHLVENNIEVKEQQIKTLQDQYEIASAGLDNLSKEHEELQIKYNVLRADFDKIQNNTESEIILLKDDNNRKDTTILTLQNKISELQADLNIKKYTEDDLHMKLDQQREAIESAIPKIDNAAIQADYESKIAGLNDMIQTKSNAIVERDNAISILTKEKQQLNETISALNAKIVELQTTQVADYKMVPDMNTVNTSTKQIYYMFGHATEKIKDQLVRFISELYNGVDDTHAPYQLISIETAALRAQISDKTRNVFIKRLYEMTSNNQHLIYDKDDHICSDFTRDYIIEYVTRLNPAAN